MLTGFLGLLGFLLLGETLVYVFALPLPGAVVGMGLLLTWLLWRRADVPASLNTAATGILQILSLLFVPAGAGVILHLARLKSEWPAIVGAVLIGTLLSIAVTALFLQWLQGRRKS
jgi:holin-like protein